MQIKLYLQGGRNCPPLFCHTWLCMVGKRTKSVLFWFLSLRDSPGERFVSMCLGKQKQICCRSWLRKAWSNVMSPSTERFHKWNHHYFRLHCYDFFLQGTALPPLLSAPLKYVQLIPHSCLGFALETLSAGPCPSVLPTPAWVGPFNKWYQGLLSNIWISMENIPREYF